MLLTSMITLWTEFLAATGLLSFPRGHREAIGCGNLAAFGF